MIEPFARLMDVAALLLSFGLVLGGPMWRALYIGQIVVLAVSAAIAAGTAGAWAGLVSVPILLAQAAAIPRLLRGAVWPVAAAPVVTLAVSLALTVLAAAVPFADGFAVPLTMVLLGLLAACRGDAMRLGVLLLLNGAEAANLAGPIALLGLAGLAAVVASDGMPRWSALR